MFVACESSMLDSVSMRVTVVRVILISSLFAPQEEKFVSGARARGNAQSMLCNITYKIKDVELKGMVQEHIRRFKKVPQRDARDGHDKVLRLTRLKPTPPIREALLGCLIGRTELSVRRAMYCMSLNTQSRYVHVRVKLTSTHGLSINF